MSQNSSPGGPRVVVVDVPIPPRVTCPRCFGADDPARRTTGSFATPAHLSKHLSRYHPGDTVTYRCAECGYLGQTRYPRKNVLEHYEAAHGAGADGGAGGATRSRRVASTATTSTVAATLATRVTNAMTGTSTSATATRTGTGTVRRRSPRATPATAEDEERRVTRNSATRGRALSTTQGSTRHCGPYVVHTTAPHTTTDTATTTTATRTLRVPSVTSPATSPTAYVSLASSGSDREDRSPSYAAVTAAPPTRTSGSAATTGEEARGERQIPRARTTAKRTTATNQAVARRQSNTPEGAGKVATLRAFYESSPEERAATQAEIRNTPPDRRPPQTWYTPPTTSGVSPVDARGDGSAPLQRAPRTNDVEPLPAVPMIPLAGGVISTTSPPWTCTVVASSPARVSPVTVAVAGPPATLTTCTFTTSAAGSPIMSSRLSGAGGVRVTPHVTPSCTPPTVWPSSGTAVKRTTNTIGERGPRLRPRRAPATRIPSSSAESEGDHEVGERDVSWTVARSRTARRRERRVNSSSSEDSVTGAAPRAVVTPPPSTRADFPPLPREQQGARRLDGRTSPVSTRRATPVSIVTGISSSGDTVARRNVRGVMGRGGALARPARATTARVDGSGSRARPPAIRRDPPGAAGPPRNPPVAAADAEMRPARRRAMERAELVALAGRVESPVELEALATRVVGFLEGNGQGGGGRRPGRPFRSREAGNARTGEGEVGQEDANAERVGAPAPPRDFFETRGGNATREAARIQALFRKNRRKAMRGIIDGPSEVCEVPTEEVHRWFCALHSVRGRLVGAEPVERREADGEIGGGAELVRQFAEREVDRRLKRMNNTAPGPDGLTYNDLRKTDGGARLLTALFNACLRLKAVPEAWKRSNTVLIHKKGDRADLSNWRPLALGDTMPKLFAALLADRLTNWAVANRKLNPAQKGFLRDEGCYEHNFVLQEILTEARRAGREVVVSWLDLSNAFGSVPHEAIRRALVRTGVPEDMISIWESMYDGCTTRVRTMDGYTAPIRVRSGVRQGCPMSPIVFNLVIDSVLHALAECGPGYDLMGHRWSVMAYADDLVLVSRTPADMKRLLSVAENEASAVGLRFNPAKCATLHIGAGRGNRVLPTTFEIQGQPVRAMAEGEAYEHLGIPTGFEANQTPHAAMLAICDGLRAVDRSLLAPWQKLDAVATFLLPRMDFMLRGAHVEKTPLKQIDLQIRRLAKKWLNLPQRASAEVVYMPPHKGGCGLLPMSDLADVLTIAHVFRLLTADDRAVRDLAWASLRGVVTRRIGGVPSCDDVAAFLSGSLEGRLRGGGEASLWSRARNAARRQSDRCAIRWRWSEELGELTLECRGSRGRITKIPPGARAQVIGRVRAAVAEYYDSTIRAKPDQGKVFEVSSRSRVSNHFVRGGNFTRFADWRFVHRARLDVLPLNGARRWGDGDRRCRRCGAESETLPHVICHCGPHSAAIQWRHDSILLRLKRACRLPGEVRVNQRVEGIDGELGALRPDLVIRHEPSKSVVICDVTVPFENRWAAFEEARARKVAKYSPLAEKLQQRGYRVVVTAFVVGALGSWDPRNEPVLRLLRVGKAYASMMRRLMVSDSIRWSRDIYVEHVSGMRQYEAPPRRADGGAPDVSPPRAVRRRATGARANGEVANLGPPRV